MEENREKKEKTGFMAQGRSVLIAIIAALTGVLFKTSKWVFYGEDAQ